MVYIFSSRSHEDERGISIGDRSLVYVFFPFALHLYESLIFV